MRLKLIATFFFCSCPGPNAETCNGFDQLIRNVMQMTCTRNQECDTASCIITNPSFGGHTLSLTLLSCRVPRPGVRLVARNPGGQLLIDRVLDQSQSGIELTSNTVLDMTVDQRNNSIGLAVCTLILEQMQHIFWLTIVQISVVS